VAAELKPVYLVVGADRPKIARALDRLRDRIGEGGTERLSAREASGDDAVSACNALGLFGGAEGRLVIVTEVERWKRADVDALAAYVKSPAADTVLALTGGAKADGPLARAVRAGGEVLVYDVQKRGLPSWVAEQFGRFGVRVDSETCRALVEQVGEDLDDLATEVDKLATWAGGEPLGGDDVRRLVAPRADTPIYELTDAWGRRDVSAALAACEVLVERSHRARRDEVMRIAASLAGHVTRVRACKRLAADGIRARDAASRLNVRPYAAEKAFRHAAEYGEEELRSAVVRLAALDHGLKGGSRLAPDLELERAVVEITPDGGRSGGRRRG
jgi:DNA polymerase III subunit delta